MNVIARRSSAWGPNMRNSAHLVLAGVLAVAAVPAPGAEGPRNWLLVESPHSQDVQVIDPATREVVRNIPVGEHTDDVMGSPDGRVFYVGAQDDMRSPFGYQNNESGKVMAFDSASFEPLWSIALDGSPNHMSRSPDGTRIYVPLYTRQWLVVLDAKDGSIVHWWPATIGNHATEISADGKRLYVGNMVTDAIYVYDTATGKVVMSIDAGESVRPIVLDEPRGLLYYQLSRLHGFEVRRLADGSFVKRVDLPALEKPVGPADGDLAARLANLEGANAWPYTYNHGLAMTRDGRHLVAVATVANYAAVYSLPDFTLKGTVPVGGSPNWVACDPEGRYAYVSNPKDDSVSVIDIEAVREAARIPVGKGPKRVAFSVE
jgi:YVTN family beta-propeller protein